ncbi:hypothetical protein [Lewinella sp. IMCC34183]|uniref:hypothetical protein n=1 Tax=Lewinella sp. IMCC34183 TaxID=2248762 RepID=UPI000E22D864|nr:hypothetical protein [Lewinella sp. IMCC34183]
MKWILLLLLLPCLLPAQSPEAYGPDYRFRDGVYLTHEALLANQPDVEWSEIAGEMVQLSEDHRVQIDGYGYKSGNDRGTPYAIALDGLPYLFVQVDGRRGFSEFAGLLRPGRYPTVAYDTTVNLRRLMKAYNPANGKPFREGYVERQRRERITRILDMDTGTLRPLDRATVLLLVRDERDLRSALEQTPDATTDKLLRALEIYNSRHPLLLPAPPAQR